MSALQLHAADALRRNPSNDPYASQVLARAKRLRELIGGDSGIIEGVVSSSLTDVKWLAEAAFGEQIADDEITLFTDYVPTVFPGLVGRIRPIGECRTEGQLVSLDFLGGGD